MTAVMIGQQSPLAVLLLPNACLLIYTLPLFLVSLILTFSGSFLTFDRTRSFKPTYDAIPPAGALDKKHRIHWILEGGIGGLAIGYVFGVHFSTFLSLLIPAVTSSSHLDTKSFSAVWILSTFPCVLVSGRLRYAALILVGMVGGATLAVVISVMIHPPLLVRIVCICVLAPLSTIAAVLPLSRTQQASLRFLASSTGAFGVILCAALLSKENKFTAWTEVWERLYYSDGEDWGSSGEKGLTAAWSFLLIAGLAVDWILCWRYGENPDQKWDDYLAKYTSNLPDRAGVFQPISSFWDKLFHCKTKRGTMHTDSMGFSDTKCLVPEDMVLKTTEDDLDTRFLSEYAPRKSSPVDLLVGGPHSSSGLLDPNRPHKLRSKPDSSSSPPPYPMMNRSPTFLKKPTRTRSQAKYISSTIFAKSRRQGVKFRPDDIYLSSDEDDYKATPVPSLPQRQTSQSTLDTLVERHHQQKQDAILGAVQGVVPKTFRKDQAPEYSDIEEDIALMSGRARSQSSSTWVPEFMKKTSNFMRRPFSDSSATSLGFQKQPQPILSSTLEDLIVSQPVLLDGVSLTPSLIHALDRITTAQRAVYGLETQLSSGLSDRHFSGTASTRAQLELSCIRSDNDSADHNPFGEQQGDWKIFWKDVRNNMKF